MANKSLPATPLSNNDVSTLAKLLEGNFKYTRENPSPIKKDYMKNLKAVVGLGFTAICVDGSFTSSYLSYFNRFLDHCGYSQCDSIAPVSLEASRILETAACVFPKYDLLPEYYQTFTMALRQVVKSGLLDSSEIAKEDDRLLKWLLRK